MLSIISFVFSNPKSDGSVPSGNFTKYTYIFQILSFNYEKDCKNILHIVKKDIDLNKYKLNVIDKSDTSSAVDIVKYRTIMKYKNVTGKNILYIKNSKEFLIDIDDPKDLRLANLMIKNKMIKINVN